MSISGLFVFVILALSLVGNPRACTDVMAKTRGSGHAAFLLADRNMGPGEPLTDRSERSPGFYSRGSNSDRLETGFGFFTADPFSLSW